MCHIVKLVGTYLCELSDQSSWPVIDANLKGLSVIETPEISTTDVDWEYLMRYLKLYLVSPAEVSD